MNLQLNRLEMISSINNLIEMKENLKEHVMDPLLNWRERMELYESIQKINIRIQALNKK